MIAQERQQAQQRAVQSDARTHDFAAVLGAPLSALRDGAAMHDRVQAQLEDAEFVASFYAQTQLER